MSSFSNSTSERLELLASCAPGLEPILAEELTSHGFRVLAREPGGVVFRSDSSGMMRANLDLGCALQVLWRVARFNAHDFRELEKRLDALPFSDWLLPGTHVRVRAFSRRSRLYHTGALVSRVQEALARRAGARPVSESDGAADQAVGLVLRVHRDRAVLAIDTSGAPLHRRGYRLAGGVAPLREDLACALLRLSGYDGSAPLFDPMTGSGTLAIEAVRLRLGRLPGALRRFGFERLKGYEEEALRALRQRTFGTGAAPIVARDRDAASVQRARENARRAGVEQHIAWEVAGLSEASAADSLGPGWLVANPPYGKRMGDPARLARLYAALGQRARGLKATLALVTAHSRLAARTGMNMQSRLLTDLGGLKVRFYVSDSTARASE